MFFSEYAGVHMGFKRLNFDRDTHADYWTFYISDMVNPTLLNLRSFLSLSLIVLSEIYNVSKNCWLKKYGVDRSCMTSFSGCNATVILLQTKLWWAIQHELQELGFSTTSTCLISSPLSSYHLVFGLLIPVFHYPFTSLLSISYPTLLIQ